MQTKLMAQLGIQVPIIQAPMNWGTDAGLVAAVCNAGGLGTLGPNAGIREPIREPEGVAAQIRSQIREIRRLTDRPFAVNFPIGRGPNRVYSDASIAVAIAERIPIAVIATGSPEVYTERLKAAGIFVIHAIASVKHALKAQECGVDAVVAEGFEGGGHSGFEELTMSTLVPQVARAVQIPVIAAGGIVNGQGLVAALGYGAQAVYMGTRFLATVECPVHDKVKAAIVQATDQSTLSWGRKTEVARTLRNAFAEEYRNRELSGASREELHHFIAHYDQVPGGRRVAGLKHGDLDQGEIFMGAGAGLIKEVLTCEQVISRTVAEAGETIRYLSGLTASR